MCSLTSDSFPKEFEKTTEVLPLTNYGLSSIQEFKDSEKEIHNLEWLKNVGLTTDEINMYKENEAGLLEHRKIESNVMKEQLEDIYKKIKQAGEEKNSNKEDCQPSTSNDILKNPSKDSNHSNFYPEGHPMNNIKEIEEKLFSHLKDDMMPINKRRKILRRLERKKERILSQENQIKIGTIPSTGTVDRPGSLWDVKELPHKLPKIAEDKQIGPKKPTMYTVKDNKIVRLEPVNEERQEEYRAVDIVMPVNNAEAQLLEGTKMCVDDIKKIDRFKDYEPGVPSKTLFLKNIAPSVTQEQLSLLFNQFLLENGGPIDVRLMTGQMRGQAFVSFLTKNIAIQALEEVNGTILSGRPIIAQFGRNTNRIQHDNIDDNR